MLKSIPQTPTRIFFFPQFSKKILSYPWRTRQNFFYSMKTKYFQKKNSHKGKNQDLTKNTHFCVFSKMHIFAYAIFCLEFFFFSCYKKKYTEFAMAKITFLVQLGVNSFFLLVFGVWILAFVWEKNVPFQKSATFCKKNDNTRKRTNKKFCFHILDVK